jgi:hypothetical protein
VDFKSKLEYVQKHRKIDVNKFDTVKEITNLVDFHNKAIEDDKDKRAENEIHEISKFLARIGARKMFFMK